MALVDIGNLLELQQSNSLINLSTIKLIDDYFDKRFIGLSNILGKTIEKTIERLINNKNDDVATLQWYHITSSW